MLALDPSVSEDILKLYVAYKAETNFVNLVPLKTRLRLSLNLDCHELHDPGRMATDRRNEPRPMGQRQRRGLPEQARGFSLD